MNPNSTKKLKDSDRDLWYKEMSEKTPVKPEDEPVVGLMEWVDLMDYFQHNKSKM